MTDKFADNRESVADSLVFDLGADIAQSCAFNHHANGARQSRLGDSEQLVHPVVDHSHRDGSSGIAYPSILNHSNIQLHDVAVLNPALTADPMNNLVVKRNANITRKNTVA